MDNSNFRGKFIVIYGINNLGKSTQAKILAERLNNEGIKTEYLKYPIYDLAPSGPTLNNYLRGGNFFNLSAREAQIIYALNRTQYQNELEQKLNQGINIIAEDYVGTGIAWGTGTGVDENFLKYINRHLLKEDLVILLDGQRFSEATEKNHLHEKNQELTNKVRLAHLKLAEEQNWIIINANQPIEKIHGQIFKKVKKIIKIKDYNDLEKMIQKSYPPRNDSDENINKEKNIEITTINPAISDIKNINNGPKIISYNDDQRLSKGLSEIKTRDDGKNIPSKQDKEKADFILKVQKTNPKAKIPSRAHAEDAGLDLYANDHYTLYENERALIATGIKMAIPNGYAGLIWDKSGLAASGLKTGGGVIDSGFRGEIKIIVINLSGDIYHIKKGQKIAQILIQKIKTPELVESGEMEKTARATGSFGSSGIF